MTQRDWRTQQFEDHRAHLRAVAYRMLGSPSEADDAVQEAWLRLDRTDTDAIDNLGGWLTTVVSRLCLDMLRSRAARRDEPAGISVADVPQPRDDSSAPEHEAIMADSVGLAMLVVLDTLTPAERVAFVLHDMFAVPFDDIATIVGRSPTATRKLASRARSRVQGGATVPDADLARQRTIVDAFLAASRRGDFSALLALLDPQVAMRADPIAVQSGATAEVLGARAVADVLSGRARAAQLATVDGAPGLVWAPGGRPKVVFEFKIDNGKIVEIDLVMDPDRVVEYELELLDV
jgi:RNA polymerase sigma-70 factor (ECF subfamily)